MKKSWGATTLLLAFLVAAATVLADIRYFADPDPLARIIKERSARSAFKRHAEEESKRSSRETRTNNAIFANAGEEFASNAGKCHDFTYFFEM
jgi:hypothetical protein